MQTEDHLGLSYSCDAIQWQGLNAALDGYLHYGKNTMDQLTDLLSDNNTIPMAHCFRGYLLKMGSDPRFRPMLQSCVDALQDQTLNARESLHAQALQQWVNDDLKGALATFEVILARYPRDMIALKAAHNLHFYAGDMAGMRDSIARVLPAWESTHPWFSFVEGMYAFGLEETGDYDAAFEFGCRASDANRSDMWAAHAVAHVHQMRGESAKGIDWIAGRIGAWQNTNNFVFHLHWHKALFHLGACEPEVALSIYDEHLVPALDQNFYLDVCNAASLLWRLQMLGLDVKNRLRSLKQWSAVRVADDELVFVTLHYLMAPVLLGDKAQVSKGLSSLRAWSERDTTQGRVAREVGLPMAEAITNIEGGSLNEGLQQLAAVQNDIIRIGGSHAQRHLFSEALSFYGQQ